MPVLGELRFRGGEECRAQGAVVVGAGWAFVGTGLRHAAGVSRNLATVKIKLDTALAGAGNKS